MNDFLWQTYHRLIAETHSTQYRSLYYQLKLTQRLTGLVGARGVGKTTLLLQYIKNNLYKEGKAFYFSADNIFFNTVSILSYVDRLYQKQDIRYFFIDEIHRYPNWSQELKNIYDSFPKIHIIFSGSSSIDLVHGAYDLSRRATLLHLPGLSFREYLNLKTNNHFPILRFDELLENHQALASHYSHVMTITKHFEEFISYGYYPIVFQDRENLYHIIANVIDKTIYEDIANFYNLKTNNLIYFKKIINFLATTPPVKVNTNNIAKRLGVDNKTVNHYLEILVRTGMARLLYPKGRGHQLLSKAEKIYLDNTTLLDAANLFLSEKLNIGAQRELAFIQMISNAGISVFYSDIGDFIIKNIVFEIGGKNKKLKQIAAYAGKKFIVKDNILIGTQNEIPLYLFGFLY